MKGFWSGVGKVFAAIGKGALKGAAWASEHPEAVQMLAALAQSAAKS